MCDIIILIQAISPSLQMDDTTPLIHLESLQFMKRFLVL